MALGTFPAEAHFTFLHRNSPIQSPLAWTQAVLVWAALGPTIEGWLLEVCLLEVSPGRRNVLHQLCH